MGDAGARHLLADASVLQKVGLGASNESAQENVSLVNKGYGKVADHLAVAFVEDCAVVSGVVVCGAKVPEFRQPGVAHGPLAEVVDAQIVFIIQQQLLQGGFCNVQQFYFCLTRCC